MLFDIGELPDNLFMSSIAFDLLPGELSFEVADLSFEGGDVFDCLSCEPHNRLNTTLSLISTDERIGTRLNARGRGAEARREREPGESLEEMGRRGRTESHTLLSVS